MADYVLDTPTVNHSLLGIFCATCEVTFQNEEEHKLHYRSDFHQFNLKRKMLQLPPINEEQFQIGLQKILERAKQENQEKKVERTRYCEYCRKSFKSNETYQNHLRSKKHLENMKKPIKKAEKKVVDVTTLTNINACLFCNHLSNSLDE